MLYVSKNAQGTRGWSARTWLAIGYAVAALLVAMLAVAACTAQSDRIEDALTGARSVPTTGPASPGS